MGKIDLEQLRKDIRSMKRHQPLYRLIRDEMKLRGNWRYNQRGKPEKGYRIMKEGKEG